MNNDKKFGIGFLIFVVLVILVDSIFLYIMDDIKGEDEILHSSSISEKYSVIISNMPNANFTRCPC